MKWIEAHHGGFSASGKTRVIYIAPKVLKNVSDHQQIVDEITKPAPRTFEPDHTTNASGGSLLYLMGGIP